MAVASALPAPAGKELACKSTVAICFEFGAESFLVTTHMDQRALRTDEGFQQPETPRLRKWRCCTP